MNAIISKCVINYSLSNIFIDEVSKLLPLSHFFLINLIVEFNYNHLIITVFGINYIMPLAILFIIKIIK